MRVGFDATGILGHGGLKTYARELVRALVKGSPDWTFVLLTRGTSRVRRLRELFGDAPNLEIRGWLPHTLMFGARLQALTALVAGASWRISGRDLDLVHLTDPFGSPALPPRFVATVNDLFPLTRPELRRTPLHSYYSRRTPGILARASAVIVPSSYIALQVEELYPGVCRSISVVPDAASEVFRRNGTDTAGKFASHGERYFLSVGRMDGRKNLPRILDAYLQLPGSIRSQVGLLIALSGPLVGGPPELPAGARVIRDATDEDLAVLYRRAEALVFPSLDEGFGLPVVEAMSCGCPVITSDGSSLPEVAGGAALLLDPLDTAAISAAMERVATTPGLSETLAEAGLKRASELSWGRTAGDTMKVYSDVDKRLPQGKG